MKKEKKDKNRGLDLGGLGARRGKKKALARVWEAGVGTPARGRAGGRAGREGQAGGG